MNALVSYLESCFRKNDVRIVVTDSGLGGLSVAAELVERLKARPVFRRAQVVYFNALFDPASGYNRLKQHSEKVHIFEKVLQSIKKNIQPDLLLIACNTLSVIYAETQFARQTKIPVIDILEAGVNLIRRNLNSDPKMKVIIFGTPTTIETGYYRISLLNKGIASHQIVEQACLELVDSLERGWNSSKTRNYVFQYVTEALQKMNDPVSPFYVSLNCTHFGYALKWWEQAFQQLNRSPQAILNPNSDMLGFLQRPALPPQFSRTEITVTVVSKVEISPDMIQSIGELVQLVSPITAEALRLFQLRPELF